MRARRTALLVLAVAAVSCSAPLVRVATDAPPLVIGFWRTFIASAVLAPFALARHGGEISRLGRRDLAALAAAGVLLAVHFATWIASVDLTTVASSVLLVNAQPVFVAALSGLMGEPLVGRGWVGIAVAVAGGGLVAAGDVSASARSGLGDALAAAGALSAAGYLLSGRRLRTRLSLLTYVVAVYGACSAMLLAGIVAAKLSPFGYSGRTWLAILAIAAFPQLLGHTLFNYMLRRLEAAKVSVAITGETVGSALIAAWAFGEVPGALFLPGAVLLLAGVGLVLTSGGRLARAGPSG